MPDNDTSNRWPSKSRDAISREDHAHSDTRFPNVSRQIRQGWWEQAHRCSSNNAIDASPGVQPSQRGHTGPREEADCGDERHGYEACNASEMMCDGVGKRAADNAHAVDDEQKVQGVRVFQGLVQLRNCKGSKVVEREKGTPESLIQLASVCLPC